MKYSFIIPVFNRPDEVDELLESLTRQTLRDFEVVVVEDGSSVPCKEVVDRYADRLTIQYYNKENSGPGQTRNYGVERAHGEYMLILDSDCIIPEGYLEAVEAELRTKPADAFGGPDRAHDSFSDVQKAINYAMTSFFTTGGIRGGKKKLDKFYPRSFNMGVRKDVYQALGGFSKMRFGEDIDFSIRIFTNKGNAVEATDNSLIQRNFFINFNRYVARQRTCCCKSFFKRSITNAIYSCSFLFSYCTIITNFITISKHILGITVILKLTADYFAVCVQYNINACISRPSRKIMMLNIFCGKRVTIYGIVTGYVKSNMYCL